eukprot:EG_transcript_2806
MGVRVSHALPPEAPGRENSRLRFKCFSVTAPRLPKTEDDEEVEEWQPETNPVLHHRLLMGHTSSRCMIRDDTTVSIESSLGHDEDSEPSLEDVSLMAIPTMPWTIRSSLARRLPSANPATLVTEDQLDQDIISRSSSMCKPYLLDSARLDCDGKRQKPATIYNYTMHTLLGRSNRIKALRLSPCERRMVYCSMAAPKDKRKMDYEQSQGPCYAVDDELVLILYDLVMGHDLLHFEGHSEGITSACFSPDGKYVCSASKDTTIIRWDISTGKRMQVLSHDSPVMCCDYSPDGEYIVAGCQERVCTLWDARLGKLALTFTLHTAMVVAVAFSPDSTTVCSASADRSLMVWEVRTGKRRFVLEGHAGVVLSCGFSRNGHRIVSNDEKTIHVWSARDGKSLKTWDLDSRVPSRTSGVPLPGSRPEMKYMLSAFTASSHIVTSVNNKVVQLLDPTTGQETLSLFLKAAVCCISCGSGNTIALGDANGNLYIVHLKLETDPSILPHSPRGRITGCVAEED